MRQLSLLQSAMDCYYKLRQLFYYKVRHGLLQFATGITKCDGFITNFDRYYKVRWLLQIATVQDCGSLLLSRWTPLSPDNNIQILKADLHAFPSRISRENLIEEALVTMFYLFSQFYFLMMSCWCLEKINVGPVLGL